MTRILRKFSKTSAMAAVGHIGESRLFLLNYLMRGLRVILLLSLWRTLLTGRGTVSGMTLDAVLTYTLIAEIFADVLACRTWLEGAFWDGSITTRFLRPLGIFGQFAAEMFGPIFVGLTLFSLPLLLCAPLLGVHPLPASWGQGQLFLVSLVLAVLVGLALEYIFSALAIVLQLHPYILNSVRAAIGTVLTGSLLPLALYPWGLGEFFGYLPFAAQASAPLRIYTGTGPALQLIGLQVFWVVLLWPVAVLLWQKNSEKMISFGG